MFSHTYSQSPVTSQRCSIDKKEIESIIKTALPILKKCQNIHNKIQALITFVMMKAKLKSLDDKLFLFKKIADLTTEIKCEVVEKSCFVLVEGKGYSVDWEKQSPLKEINDIRIFNGVDKNNIKKLLQHVVYGEKDEVEAILKMNPSLVLESGQAIDYSGRTIEGTAYQMALGAGDVNRVKVDKDNKSILDAKGHIQVFHHNEGMAEMIQGYFKQALRNVEAAQEIQKQQEEQFPGGYEKYTHSKEIQDKRAEDIAALEAISSAINNASPEDIKCTKLGDTDRRNPDKNDFELDIKKDSDLAKALETFRNYVKPKGVIKKGNHFNVELLIHAFKKYTSDKDVELGYNYKNPKNILFWRQVIGYLQRQLPANYASVFCQGFCEVVEKKQLLKRDLTLNEGSLFFYPRDIDARTALGFDYSIYSCWGGWRGWSGCGSIRSSWVWQQLEDLYRTRTAVLIWYYSSASPSVSTLRSNVG